MNIAISWCFLGYFIILFAERIQSLIRALNTSDAFSNGFNVYVNMITAVSLLATVVMLVGFNGSFWKSLFDGSTPNYSMLIITVGVILVSGMVHTEYTIAPVQFGAYGVLIVGMLLKTIQLSQASSNKLILWYSLAFITVFSMAIPVMYQSNINNARVFHIIEAVVALVLVFYFTYMLRELFVVEGANLLMWVPMIIAAVGDAVIIGMRWKESVNSFVLIFVVLSLVMFIIGKILFAKI